MSRNGNHPIDSDIALLARVDDIAAGAATADTTREELLREITSTPRQRRSFAAGLRRWAPRWQIAVPALAALAVLAVAVSVMRPAQVGPVEVGPKPANAAISIERKNDYYIARVKDPVADPKRFRAAFAELGLDINLTLIPASPQAVGTVAFMGGDKGIETITARGECFTGGGGYECPVGLKIPVDFGGHADIVFGRAARPGESFETSTQEWTEGGMLHCVDVVNMRFGAAMAELKAHDLTATEFRHLKEKPNGAFSSRSPKRAQIPDHWYVHAIKAWAPGEVMAFVGPRPKEQVYPPPTEGCPSN